jgi:hypothetical protein
MTFTKKPILCIIAWFLLWNSINAQIVINEGSNRNYTSIADENGDFPDWIELFNAGPDTVSLLNYTLTDKVSNPAKWAFPDVKLAPGQFKTIFCSGKDRKPISGFVNVRTTGEFTPLVGWNTHSFTTPFYWDGTSNLLINICSYSSFGYTSNSVFNQTATTFPSTVFGAQDGSPSACWQQYGTVVNQRPNMKFNGKTVGTGSVQNSPYDYPAPYGNWYWGARNQMLVLASELSAAGLNPGFITNMSFSVAQTDPSTVYDYIDINLKLVSTGAVSSEFEPIDPNNNLHTNFKISRTGETIYLYSPNQVLLSSLFVNCHGLDNSRGSFPDGSNAIYLFQQATPSNTNNLSATYTSYLLKPSFTVPSGIYNSSISVAINNPNTGASTVYYTLDGSNPSTSSTMYLGNPIQITYSAVLKACAISNDALPSPNAVSSYLLGIEHTTPILSVATDDTNLYGVNGIFDNWWTDWQKASYVEYFDSTQSLVFSQNAGMQMDGGAGGSRSNPQHSFRIELDNGVLGEGPINYHIIPDRPNRSKYSKIYLRNGSNQYLILPYKDAAQVKSMGKHTNNYYSAWRPVTVYINGGYFGLYELREKFDAEYFETLESADPENIDLLSLSAWYNFVLRPIEGSVDSFFTSYNAFNQLDPAEATFWDKADAYFDMSYYNDYIIAESWMSNTDWPGNNIKIYRSAKTGNRWRFCLVDLELALQPNGWSDIYYDHIQYMLGQSTANPYINIWLKGLQNERFHNYFINRYADVMNTAYLNNVLTSIENDMFNLTAPEMQKEYARWGDPNNVLLQMIGFNNNHLLFNSQLAERTEQVRNHIQTGFGLANQVSVTLNVLPEGAGTIRISTVEPESYPWNGIYFNGVPVTIEALPEEGFAFINWDSNNLISDTLNAVFNDTLNAETAYFTAHFANTTSIHNLALSKGFSLYPNPAKEVLIVQNLGFSIIENLKYQVSNTNGEIVKNGVLQNLTTGSTIHIQTLPSGVYQLVLLSSKGIVERLRFVKI